MTVAATVGLVLGHGVELGLGDGEPLAEGVAVGVAVGFGLGLGLGVGLGDGLADGLTDGLSNGLAVGETVGVARGAQGVLCTRTEVSPAVLVDWWVRSSAAGTMMMPSATATTKASAPHSRRQKAHEEFRIRGLRPFPGSAYSCCSGCGRSPGRGRAPSTVPERNPGPPPRD